MLLQLLCIFSLLSVNLAQRTPLSSRMAFQSLTNGTQFSSNPALIEGLNLKWPDLNLDTSSVVLHVPSALYSLDRGYSGHPIGDETVIFSPDGVNIHHHLVIDIPGLFSGELVVRFTSLNPQPFQVCLFGFGDATLQTPDGILTTAANAGVGTIVKAEGQLLRFHEGSARVSGVINQDGPFVTPGVSAFGDIIWVLVQAN